MHFLGDDMGLLDRLFQRKQLRAPQIGPRNDARLDASRRELLSMAVHDTLNKCGIPDTWITLETSAAFTARKVRGMHLRLVVREWHPTLLDHGLSLQKLINARMSRLDPLFDQWLTGISWKFDLVDESNHPTMPAPLYWQSIAARSAAAPAQVQKSPSQRAVLDELIDAGDQRHAEKHDAWVPTQPMVNF